MNILVVDDEPLIHISIEKLIQSGEKVYLSFMLITVARCWNDWLNITFPWHTWISKCPESRDWKP